ncbi:MAG: DNA double-strand break repair nuclease NurA, partial [Candidatus Diapherotrites archaeon]|nr:DNA double-strand break repair nuclease NurA [Candidatus Diapherotrites archaeon]
VPVQKSSLNFKIAGVDSGFVGKNFAAFDLLFIRAVGAVFDYRDSKLLSAAYYPNSFSFPEPIALTDSLERDEFNSSMSLHRLLQETTVSREIIEKFQPKYLFIDGSIVPQHADKPRTDSKVSALYREVLNSFQELYKTAQEKNCKLIATVEDSRGIRFKSIIQAGLKNSRELGAGFLDNYSDASLLDSMLSKGQRSAVFKYTSNTKQHPILHDFLPGWSEKIFAFYLKCAEFDRPIRIEFISSEEKISETAQELAGIVFALSSLHKEYSYPTVLIEADLRARLRPEEIEIVFDRIASKTGKHLLTSQRRDKRPF